MRSAHQNMSSNAVTLSEVFIIIIYTDVRDINTTTYIYYPPYYYIILYQISGKYLNINQRHHVNVLTDITAKITFFQGRKIFNFIFDIYVGII